MFKAIRSVSRTIKLRSPIGQHPLASALAATTMAGIAAAGWALFDGTRAQAAAGTAAVAVIRPSPSDQLGAEQRLALEQPDGRSELDVRLERLQTRARQNSRQPDNWVALGEAWVRKARGSFRPQYYRNAEACAELALALGPEHGAALDLRALALLNRHQFEEVRRLMNQSIARNPSNPAAYGNLSDALLELGQMSEAVQAVQKMVDLKPNLPAYSRAAHLRWLHGDTAAATHLIKLAIDAGANARDREPRAWVTVQAAQMFWQRGDYEGAEAGFDLALESLPDYPPALVGKGRIALGRGDAQRASELLAQAYRQSPLVETAFLLGHARKLDGAEAAAEQSYAAGIEHGRAHDELALSLFFSTLNRDAVEALALVEGELKERSDLYTEDVYAWALYRNGRLSAARSASDRALRYGTPDARFLYHSGAIRIAQGELREGRKLVERALRLNPEFDVFAAREARALLASSRGLVRAASLDANELRR